MFCITLLARRCLRGGHREEPRLCSKALTQCPFGSVLDACFGSIYDYNQEGTTHKPSGGSHMLKQFLITIHVMSKFKLAVYTPDSDKQLLHWHGSSRKARGQSPWPPSSPSPKSKSTSIGWQKVPARSKTLENGCCSSGISRHLCRKNG